MATSPERPEGMVSTFRLMSPFDLASPTAVRYGRSVLLETAATVNRSYALGPVNSTGSEPIGGGDVWLGPIVSKDSAQIWLEGDAAPGSVHIGDCVLLRTQEGYVNTAGPRVSVDRSEVEDERRCLFLHMEPRPASVSFALDANVVPQVDARLGTATPLVHYGARIRLLSCDNVAGDTSLCGILPGPPRFLQVRPTPEFSVRLLSAFDCELCREFELDSTMDVLGNVDPLGAASYGSSILLRTMVGSDLLYVSSSKSGAVVTSEPSSDHTVATLVHVSGKGDWSSVGHVRNGDILMLRYEHGYLVPNPQVPRSAGFACGRAGSALVRERSLLPSGPWRSRLRQAAWQRRDVALSHPARA
jgi:hypothetical protein